MYRYLYGQPPPPGRCTDKWYVYPCFLVSATQRSYTLMVVGLIACRLIEAVQPFGTFLARHVHVPLVG
jgi:hypothetical protein